MLAENPPGITLVPLGPIAAASKVLSRAPEVDYGPLTAGFVCFAAM